MKSRKSIILIWLTMATLQTFTIGHVTTSTELPLELAIKTQLDREKLQYIGTDKTTSDKSVQPTLKRKRRYLEFPEGTSFQLVYDLIVGVVDYTNYLILGVTVALAWELPSKPPSEILEDLTERLKDGTLGTSRNDTVENIKYIDKKIPSNEYKKYSQKYQYSLQPMFKPPMHYRYYSPDSYYSYKKRPTSTNTYYRPKQTYPFTKWLEKPSQYSLAGIKYPWWNLSQRLKNSFKGQQINIRRFDKNILQNKEKSSQKTFYRNYKRPYEARYADHRIYPVFGKRSILNEKSFNQTQTSTHFRFKRSGIDTEELSKWDRIHIEHHRKTRHDLYERIETYLNGRGAHGHHCVLRALCETGQKSHEHEPGSFVGEIMRAIFTMPEPLDATTMADKQIGHKEKRYDTANALQEDCANRYHLCKDSLWSSHFVL